MGNKRSSIFYSKSTIHSNNIYQQDCFTISVLLIHSAPNNYPTGRIDMKSIQGIIKAKLKMPSMKDTSTRCLQAILLFITNIGKSHRYVHLCPTNYQCCLPQLTSNLALILTAI